MRFPFVARELLTVALASKDAEIATLRDALLVERARADAMREQIAVLSAPKPVATLPRKERDAVIDAIMQRAGSDGRLVRHLSTWAMGKRQAGADDQDIITNILHWQAVSDEVGVP